MSSGKIHQISTTQQLIDFVFIPGCHSMHMDIIMIIITNAT